MENGWCFRNGDFQEMYSLQSICIQLFTVGEGIVPLETFEDDTGVDIDQHVVVLDPFLHSFERAWLILDPLNHLKEALELA